MEQIFIIERFPYPFQVSPHCTLCGSTLAAEGDPVPNPASLPPCQASLTHLGTPCCYQCCTGRAGEPP